MRIHACLFFVAVASWQQFFAKFWEQEAFFPSNMSSTEIVFSGNISPCVVLTLDMKVQGLEPVNTTLTLSNWVIKKQTNK